METGREVNSLYLTAYIKTYSLNRGVNSSELQTFSTKSSRVIAELENLNRRVHTTRGKIGHK